MKPEPLKDKTYWSEEYDLIYKSGDVKSAVEWLKEEIRLSKYYKYCNEDITFYEYILKKIDEAFDQKGDGNGK